jgi:hypothetical protein
LNNEFDEHIFVFDDVEKAYKFVKEVTTIFPNDVLTGTSLYAFTGGGRIAFHAVFATVTQEYADLMQKLIFEYAEGVINKIEQTEENWNYFLAEIRKGDLQFIGWFLVDTAFEAIRVKFAQFGHEQSNTTFVQISSKQCESKDELVNTANQIMDQIATNVEFDRESVMKVVEANAEVLRELPPLGIFSFIVDLIKSGVKIG